MKPFYRRLLPLFFASLLLSACNNDTADADSEENKKASTTTAEVQTAATNTTNDNEDKKNTMTQVKLETNFGDIVIELNAEKAPLSVANFIAYAEKGAYDGTIFHRVIKDFMIQGGGFDESFTQRPTDTAIKNEANNGLSNVKGSVAMARTGDPHSATTQFFINTVDNAFLNFRSEDQQGWGYTVFGQVIEGMDVVEQIRVVATGNKNGHGDVPNENVIITTATVVK
jgi:peptidyl-prolyl cis-trans isomerase B (cyclophilin B)